MTDLRLPFDTNWELLRRFNICCNSKNFSEAAKKIGTSPSALLHQIEMLEQEIGKTLFVRGPKQRSMRLTLKGEVIKDMTDKAFRIFSRETTSDLAEMREERKVLRILTTEGIAESILAEPLNKFLQHQDNFQLQVVIESNPSSIGKDEIAIRTNFVEQKDIVKQHLTSFYVELYASESYIKKYGAPEKTTDLLHHKILSYTYPGTSGSALLWDPELSTYLVPHIVSNSLKFLINMCYAGCGILELADLYSVEKKVVKLFPSEYSKKFPIYIAYDKSSVYNPMITKFIDHLTKYIGDNRNV